MYRNFTETFAKKRNLNALNIETVHFVQFSDGYRIKVILLMYELLI